MDLLLETHAFLWFINGDIQLPSKTRKLIENLENKCYLSIASIWEIAIKVSLDKLQLKSDFSSIQDFLVSNDIELLPLAFDHIQTLLKQEFHHRDPFDRIIISQAITEELIIISKDTEFSRYKVQLVWQ